MNMDPDIVNEASLAYSLAGIWGFGGSEVGGVGTFGDESTVTHHTATGPHAWRKRKDLNSHNHNSNLLSTTTNNYLVDSSGAKVEAESSSKTGSKATDQNSKAEPPKDYIHVRAKRGQATDSHSLAERARREKISERMKILQDLVPGCNKVIGKALVLDEIINYIQSLQRQVEILSMKLEAVNPRMNPTIESFPPKESTQGFDASAMMFGSQPPREYVQSLQPEWLHMQIGSSYEGAG